jgi:CHAD domain-containing protein
MDPSLTCGEHVRLLILPQLERLRRFQPEVLADHDPEPLHQFRVSLRRLRSVVSQFGPALVLPRHLHRSQIAVVARATGLCRDADVLREWLEQRLMPRLAADGHRSCKPLLRALRKQRRKAFADLQEELTSRRYFRMIEELEGWCDSPDTTLVGDLQLAEWLPEWLQACAGTCFLHGGWFAAHPGDSELHELRKRIKEVRYGLEALRGLLGNAGEAWIGDLRDVQSVLGDLHDLQVLMQLLGDQELADEAASRAPLQQLLEEQRQERWQQWLELRNKLLQADRRRSLVRLADTDASAQADNSARRQH